MSLTPMEGTKEDLSIYCVFPQYIKDNAEAVIKKHIPDMEFFSICPANGIDPLPDVKEKIIAKEMYFRELDEQQRRKVWDCSRIIERPGKLLSALTVGILGIGCIGGKVAEMCKKFGMTVHGLRRSKQKKEMCIDLVFITSDLKPFLEDCDYICNTLPSTSETRDMLSKDVLRHCERKKPVFINVGRGNIIDEEALLRALNNDWLSGAILDVPPQEPLPLNSQLWEHHKIIITPHIAGGFPSDFWAKVFASNYTKFLEKNVMNHAIDWSKGY